MNSIPITRVTVMEDRALIERSGEVQVQNDMTFIFEGISPLAVDRSLRVNVDGAHLTDSKLIRRFKEQPVGGLRADATALEREIATLDESLSRDLNAIRQLDHRASLFESARADLLRAIGEQSGNNEDHVVAWTKQFDELTLRQNTLDLERATKQLAYNRLEQKRNVARDAAQLSLKKERLFECLLSLSLSGIGTAQIKISYLVPCAIWRPSYRATLRENEVVLEAEAYVWQHTGEDWNQITLACSTARPTLGSSPPPLIEDVLSTRAKHVEEKNNIQVRVREEAIQSTGVQSTNEMPGLDDGGETRLIEVKHQVSIVSDGQPHRFPLFSFTTSCSTELVGMPEISPSVFCVAKFANTSNDVLLAGPVDLIRGSQFIGRGQLKFAAPQENIALSFGAQDGLQIVRHLDEKHDESRLTAKKTRRYQLNYFVSNQGALPQKIVIEERVIVSELKEVEVQVIQKESNPPPTLSSDGIARILVDLAPKSTRKAQFTWELTAASTVAGI